MNKPGTEPLQTKSPYKKLGFFLQLLLLVHVDRSVQQLLLKCFLTQLIIHLRNNTEEEAVAKSERNAFSDLT